MHIHEYQRVSLLDSRLQVAGLGIHEAEHTVFGRVIAKVHSLNTIEDLSACMKEAFLQARMRHSSVCTALDIEVAKSRLPNTEFDVVLTMEMMAKDLADEITERRDENTPFSEPDLWDFLQNMTDALAEAQTLVLSIQNICHRDIKPENVFVSEDGKYKLGDFSVAKVAQQQATPNTVCGTYVYMAPSIRRANLDRKSRAHVNPFCCDVYSLGMTLKSMMCLRVFTKDSDTEVDTFSAPYSQQLQRVLDLMLTIDEEQRPDFIKLRTVIKETMIPEEKTAKFIEEIQNNVVNEVLEAWGSEVNVQPRPQVYFRKMELLDTLASAKLYEKVDFVATSYFDYIPLSQLFSTQSSQPTIHLQIEKKQGEVSEPVAEIENPMMYKQISDGEEVFTLKINHSEVSITEPPRLQSTLIKRIWPDQPFTLIPKMMLRLGDALLITTSIQSDGVQFTCWKDNEFLQSFLCSKESVIGRTDDCDLSLKLKGVSKRHAKVYCSDGVWKVEDLRSTNGTFYYCHLQHTSARQSNEARVQDGDEFRFLSTKYVFRISRD